MRFTLGMTFLSFMLLGCATTQESSSEQARVATEAAAEENPVAVEDSKAQVSEEEAPCHAPPTAAEDSTPQAKACDPCIKGKAGEATWCDDCNKGYVDGKAVKCKGCYKAKTTEGEEPCASCDKS